MRKMISIFGVVVLFMTLLAGCSKEASDYDHLLKEYKEVVCIGMDTHSSMSEKTSALERQLELNSEYEKALKVLSKKEQSKLIMNWSKVMAEVADGKCD